MKKALSLFLVLAMCLSLWACGSTEPNMDPKKEIVGKWDYDTGSAVWTFIFSQEGLCSYYSSTYTELTYSVYKFSRKHIRIEGLDWDFTYQIKDGAFVLCYNDWEFVKDAAYSFEEIFEDTSSQTFYYPDTLFPTIEAVISQMNCAPSIIEDDLCIRYRYVHQNVPQDLYNEGKGEFQNYAQSYQDDALSSFESKTFVHEVSDSVSDQHTIWYDGTGYALIVEASLLEGQYQLDICILLETDIQAYVDTLD